MHFSTSLLTAALRARTPNRQKNNPVELLMDRSRLGLDRVGHDFGPSPGRSIVICPGDRVFNQNTQNDDDDERRRRAQSNIDATQYLSAVSIATQQLVIQREKISPPRWYSIGFLSTTSIDRLKGFGRSLTSLLS